MLVAKGLLHMNEPGADAVLWQNLAGLTPNEKREGTLLAALPFLMVILY